MVEHDRADEGQPDGERVLKPPSLLEALEHPDNSSCADCGEKGPRWVSINLGLYLCIECSGIHRSLGVHISKVRSIELDLWDPDTIKFMLEMGNKKANEIWEYNVTAEFEPKRPGPGSDRYALYTATNGCVLSLTLHLKYEKGGLDQGKVHQKDLRQYGSGC